MTSLLMLLLRFVLLIKQVLQCDPLMRVIGFTFVFGRTLLWLLDFCLDLRACVCVCVCVVNVEREVGVKERKRARCGQT